MKDTIICDLDGTISLAGHRQHMVQGVDKPDWPAFFAACVHDKPNTPVIDLLKDLRAARRTILILSGRSDEVAAETKRWLNDYIVPYDELYMRRQGDYRPDQELKREWLLNDIGHRRVAFVLDDRNKVVAMWRAEGMPCFQVEDGTF